MSNFKIGEKVVCVEPIYNLTKYGIYEIFSIKTCENCGLILFELTVPKITGETNNSGFSRCNCRNRIDGQNLFSSSRFRKLDHAHTDRIIAELLKIEEVQFN